MAKAEKAYNDEMKRILLLTSFAMLAAFTNLGYQVFDALLPTLVRLAGEHIHVIAELGDLPGAILACGDVIPGVVEAIAELRLAATTEREVEASLREFVRQALERDARSLPFLDEVRGPARWSAS